MIKRELYLKKIRPFYESSLIKILVGLRRSGKSILLQQIIEELIDSGIKSENIININFELLDYNHLKEKVTLNKYIKSLLFNNDMTYIFFDEIQLVEGYREVVNSLRADTSLNISLFLTGSNSDLLSGEMATLWAGRYVKFVIHPFVLEEIIVLNKKTIELSDEDILYDYLKWGGMPQRFEFTDETNIRIYYQDLYDSIVVRDILIGSAKTDIHLLQKILIFMIQNSGSIFSANSIIKFMKSEKIDVSKRTIYYYIDRINNSFVMNKVPRFDIDGKQQLQFREKYYVADLGLKNAMKSNLKPDFGASLETVFYNELAARGFEVYCGEISNGEIDFIAIRDGKKYYFQIVYMLLDEKIIEREFSVFNKLKDNFPKYVISMDKFDFSRDGIVHLNAFKLLRDFDKYIE